MPQDTKKTIDKTKCPVCKSECDHVKLINGLFAILIDSGYADTEEYLRAAMEKSYGL